MKYAIIKTGGKQLKVSAGESIWIEKIDAEQNKVFNFVEVLGIFDGSELHIGKPFLAKAEVKAVVQKQGKGPKIKILRFKEKSNWDRKQGHRQPYTKLFVSEIVLNGKVVDSKEYTAEEATKKVTSSSTKKLTSK